MNKENKEKLIVEFEPSSTFDEEFSEFIGEILRQGSHRWASIPEAIQDWKARHPDYQKWEDLNSSKDKPREPGVGDEVCGVSCPPRLRHQVLAGKDERKVLSTS